MKILGNRLLIEPTTPPATFGSILLPEITRQSPFGIVLALGSGPRIPAEVVIGSLVRYDTSYGSQEVLHNGRKCRIISILDAQAVISA